MSKISSTLANKTKTPGKANIGSGLSPISPVMHSLRLEILTVLHEVRLIQGIHAGDLRRKWRRTREPGLEFVERGKRGRF